MVSQDEYSKAKAEYRRKGQTAKGSRKNSKARKAYEAAKRKYRALGKKMKAQNEAKRKAGPKLNVTQALQLNAKRSKQARKQDKKTQAKELDTTKEGWGKHPEKYDYPGVDTPR